MATKKKWYQQKTTWVGVAAIASGAAGFLSGQIDVGTAIQTVIGGFAAIFGRQAIEGMKE